MYMLVRGNDTSYNQSIWHIRLCFTSITNKCQVAKKTNKSDCHLEILQDIKRRGLMEPKNAGNHPLHTIKFAGTSCCEFSDAPSRLSWPRSVRELLGMMAGSDH